MLALTVGSLRPPSNGRRVLNAKSGCIRLQQLDPAEISPGEFASEIVDAVQKQNVRVVAIGHYQQTGRTTLPSSAS